MDKIPSFLKDHDKLAPGFWFSGTANGVTTFDLRFKKPNCGDFISPAASHSVEHILATLLRNGSQKQNIVYFGPMGCRTGFYLLTVNIDESQAKKALIEALEQAFDKYHDRLNCFIVEPLLQGAGGMRMYDVSFLKRARELCDQYDVLLVYDEVATGFGRTGNRFVADLVLPDILVLGKALTGGYIGHAVTVANRKVYEGFYDDDPSHALMHGPTFMGNALACSVALRSIEIFESQNYMVRIRRIEEITRREMEGFSHPFIKEIRIMGACVCVEVHDSRMIRGYQQFAYERGVFSRPFLNYLYAMVSYVITEDELLKVLNTMKEWFWQHR